jgi:pyruvate/2-oxoglutarate dehydrogenase complex dihydrolipoamide dehydrogenase (E3) component
MAERLGVLESDPFDRELLRQVRPPDWVNPTLAPRYNLVVLGGGTAGLVTAAAAAGLGARVGLVERDRLGGDCLNVGCVPSKALLRAARAAADARGAVDFGVRRGGEVAVDFAAVMERMRRLRAGLAPTDSAARFRGLGVDVFLGAGRFTGPDAVEVGGQTLRFRRAVVATGSRPALPPLPGLAEAGFLTNETVFNLTERPGRLAVVGAGPVGCELAQAFARFGTRVTLLDRLPTVLPHDDPEAAAVVAGALVRDGVEPRLASDLLRVERDGGDTVLYIKGGTEVRADAVLVATGRAPNVEGLGLEAAGVDYDARGVRVDDHLRTINPRVYAAGDVCTRFQFTHAADALARIAVQNALFFGRAKASSLVIPWCTYTDPELAHVGLTPAEAVEKGIAVDTFTQSMAHVDRAVLDGEAEGFVKVHVRKGTDRVVGVTAVGTHAAAVVTEATLAMTAGLGLRTVARTVHPYPTQTEALKKVADAYNRTRLTPKVKRLLERWFRWLR